MRAGHRSVAFAFVFLTLGLIFHTLADGSISALGIILVAVLAVAFALPAARLKMVPRRLPAVFGAVFGAQLVLHVILSVTPHAGGHMSHSLVPSALMSAAHGMAALVATVVLYFADSLAAAWSRFTASFVGERRVSLPYLNILETDVQYEHVNPIHFRLLSGKILSRGPPLSTCVY